jgi:hypothetical protein
MEGCAGDGHLPCGCPRSQDIALDAAIEHARTHPWGTATVGDRLIDAEIA